MEACDVELLVRPDEVGYGGSEPGEAHVVQVVGVRVNGVLVPVPRGSRVRVEGAAGSGALWVTLSLAPSRLVVLADEGEAAL
jgi:hypothetical protein